MAVLVSALGLSDGSLNVLLLQQSVETIREVAELLRKSESDTHRAHFYLHIWAHCILIRDHLRRIASIVDAKGPCIIEILSYLETTVRTQILLPDDIRDEAPSHKFNRLLSLDKYWKEMRLNDGDLKVKFARNYIDLQPYPEEPNKLLEYFEKWENDIVTQYPEDNLAQNDHEPQRQKRNSPSDKVWDAAQSVFNALLQSKDCGCDPVHDFGIRLRVGTYQKPPGATLDLDQNTVFEMFISMEQEWHEAHVQIDEKIRQKKVKFDYESNAHGRRKQKEREMKVKYLCQPISKKRPIDRRLEMRVDGQGRLFKLLSGKCYFAVDQPPISLEEFIQHRFRSITDKTKRILAVLLSYAVLHLNGTPWLLSNWGPSNIYFFRTINSKIPLKPFIQAPLAANNSNFSSKLPDFDEIDTDPDDLDPDDLLAHQCPSLVSLGIMLMELFLATPFETLAQNANIIPADRTSFIDADTVFQHYRYEIPRNSKFYYAVEKCLDPSIWEDEDALRLDDQTLRTKIYQEVVQPLEDELIQGFGYISLDELDYFAQNLDFDNWGQAIQNQQLNPCVSRLQKTGDQNISSFAKEEYKTLKFFDDENISDAHSTEACRRYEIWESEYRTVYEKFISCAPKDRVKIAILDTGIDKTHPDVNACEDQIKGMHNWNDKDASKNMDDRTGHGTFVATLLFKYAPDADIYIAKICDKTPPNPRIITKAIDYAVKQWDVDIITMSFGFPSRQIDGYVELERAIDRAHFKNVLLFAAASNSGANVDRAYPAGEDKVICVHSTDSNGNRSYFSPTARADTINLGTIGESVRSAWPMDLCSSSMELPLKHKSGTSFATAIAAGISGFLLQYVRLHLPLLAPKLKQKAKMEALLRRMAEKSVSVRPRDEYHYFSLSRHPSNLFGKEQQFINTSICDILENA